MGCPFGVDEIHADTIAGRQRFDPVDDLAMKPVDLPGRQPITAFALSGMLSPAQVFEADGAGAMIPGDVDDPRSHLPGQLEVNVADFFPDSFPFATQGGVETMMPISVRMSRAITVQLTAEGARLPLQIG